MNQTTHLLTLSMDYEAALARVVAALTLAGLQTERSFDLKTARAARTACACPHHGTARCDCQMGMLLVYGVPPLPATLVAHGRDGQTHLSLSDSPGQRPDPALETRIRGALASLRSASR